MDVNARIAYNSLRSMNPKHQTTMFAITGK